MIPPEPFLFLPFSVGLNNPAWSLPRTTESTRRKTDLTLYHCYMREYHDTRMSENIFVNFLKKKRTQGISFVDLHFNSRNTHIKEVSM
jgi:hypothetical protein